MLQDLLGFRVWGLETQYCSIWKAKDRRKVKNVGKVPSASTSEVLKGVGFHVAVFENLYESPRSGEARVFLLDPGNLTSTNSRNIL